MAQHYAKVVINEDIFHRLKNQLQGLMVNTHQPTSGNKRLVPSKHRGIRKDRKKLRVELFDHVGGSTIRNKSFNVGFRRSSNPNEESSVNRPKRQ